MNFKRESSLVKTNIVVLKKIFYGIYGGLLLHRIWLQKGLYPNENFYLYVDDTEYTTRLVQNGAEIYLVPESIIKDVDISWAQKSSGNLHPMLDMDVDTRRLYYTIRNSCYLSKARFVDNRFIFYTNIVLFIPLMFIRGIIHGNSFISMLKRFNLVLHAVLDGVQSRLGYKEIIPGM
jgi:GT2 family glycosyltransferase